MRFDYFAVDSKEYQLVLDVRRIVPHTKRVFLLYSKNVLYEELHYHQPFCQSTTLFVCLSIAIDNITTIIYPSYIHYLDNFNQALCQPIFSIVIPKCKTYRNYFLQNHCFQPCIFLLSYFDTINIIHLFSSLYPTMFFVQMSYAFTKVTAVPPFLTKDKVYMFDVLLFLTNVLIKIFYTLTIMSCFRVSFCIKGNPQHGHYLKRKHF